MTDKQTDPELSPFTAHLFERVAVRPLKVFRDPDNNEIVEYELVKDLAEADLVSVYACRTQELIDAGVVLSIWLADFDPSMVWAIPGFVDGLGLAVLYEFTTPDTPTICDAVTKEPTND